MTARTNINILADLVGALDRAGAEALSGSWHKGIGFTVSIQASKAKLLDVCATLGWEQPVSVVTIDKMKGLPRVHTAQGKFGGHGVNLMGIE